MEGTVAAGSPGLPAPPGTARVVESSAAGPGGSPGAGGSGLWLPVAVLPSAAGVPAPGSQEGLPEWLEAALGRGPGGRA